MPPAHTTTQRARRARAFALALNLGLTQVLAAGG